MQLLSSIISVNGRRVTVNTIDNKISTDEIIEKYSDMVYRIAYARTQNVYDAQDITQEVFLKYIKVKKEFRDEEHRKAWLLRVAVNTGNTFVKSAWARHRATLTEAEEQPYVNDDKSEVYYAVMELPEKYKVIVHLFYYEEMSIKGICEVLRISETAAKSRLHRARALLKSKLKEAEYEF